MIDYPKTICEFEWKDLHGKILKIAVAEPNPECGETTGQVYGMDEYGKIYLLLEWE